jgi:hypothetical protein
MSRRLAPGPRVAAPPLHDRVRAMLPSAGPLPARWDARAVPPGRPVAPAPQLGPPDARPQLSRRTPAPPPADRTAAARLDPGAGRERRQAIPHARQHPDSPTTARPPAIPARLVPSMGRRPVRRRSSQGGHGPYWRAGQPSRCPPHRSVHPPSRSTPGPIPRVGRRGWTMNRPPGPSRRTPFRLRSVQDFGFPADRARCPGRGTSWRRSPILLEQQVRPSHLDPGTRLGRRLRRRQGSARGWRLDPGTLLQLPPPGRVMADRLAAGH